MNHISACGKCPGHRQGGEGEERIQGLSCAEAFRGKSRIEESHRLVNARREECGRRDAVAIKPMHAGEDGRIVQRSSAPLHICGGALSFTKRASQRKSTPPSGASPNNRYC